MFEPQVAALIGVEIEPGSKHRSHGVSRTWHLDRHSQCFCLPGDTPGLLLPLFGSRHPLSFLLGRLFALGMIGQGMEKDFLRMVPIPLHQNGSGPGI